MRVITIILCAVLMISCDSETGGNSNCGDSVVDPGEDCDGEDMGGGTCITLQYYGGTLSCNSNCTYDITECQGAGVCGDNLLQPDFEECEGSDLDFQSCETLGFYSGTLACDSACQFDLSNCQGECGDGTLEEQWEECEANNIPSSCEELGYYGGVLACAPNCTFNVADCATYGVCGDGAVQSIYEECDTTSLQGATCEDVGKWYGDLSCADDCTL
ncbi:hypothetical protein KKF84_12035, partial [Myxococcota bacterium]|nr:hypothetical protein [Myxococcota bacterium]